MKSQISSEDLPENMSKNHQIVHIPTIVDTVNLNQNKNSISLSDNKLLLLIIAGIFLPVIPIVIAIAIGWWFKSQTEKHYE
jgi:hypothetical protein